MSLAASLKGFVRRLAAPRTERPFTPQYGAERLAQSLRLPAVSADPRTREIEAAIQAQRFDAAARLLPDYFRNRSAPVFLFGRGCLDRADAQHKDDVRRWIDAAGREAERLLEQGLPVYSRLAPPLRPGFPWDAKWARDCDDLLYDVRPHRFAFVPRLALATWSGRYRAEQLAALLADWMHYAERAPALPFTSNLVVAQRLLACACALFMLDAAPAAAAGDNDPAALLLQIIAEDVRFLLPRLGNSYPNNHLLLDRFVGWFITAVFPELAGNALDGALAEQQWLDELQRQTYVDGGGFEHSLHYHGLATEAAAAWLLFKRANRAPVPAARAERVRRMLELQADLAGPDGQAPAIGGATEDPLFPLDGGDGGTAAALREICRGLFAPEISPLAPAHPERERAYLLLGGTLAPVAAFAHQRRASSFLHAGMFALFDHDETTRYVLRTGPTEGAATMAGHMHADMLALYWVCRGTPVLVDAGTWSYRMRARHHGKPLRAYLCGPKAHNGIAIDAIDPLGPMPGDFRPGAAAQARVANDLVVTGDMLSLVQARMIAPADYANCMRSVVHVADHYAVVYSRAPREARARAELPLHIDAALRLASVSDVSVVVGTQDAAKAQIAFAGCTLDASPAATAGVISPGYGRLVAALRLSFKPALGAGLTVFVLNPNPGTTLERVEAIELEDDAAAFVITGPSSTRDYLIVNPRRVPLALAQHGIEFQGLLAWLCVGNNGISGLRGLQLERIRLAAAGLDLAFSETQAEVVRTWA